MLALYLRIRNLFVNEEGQDLIEYALLAALIALAVVALLGGVGESLNTIWQGISNSLGSAL